VLEEGELLICSTRPSPSYFSLATSSAHSYAESALPKLRLFSP
jgi:hypothetical protein